MKNNIAFILFMLQFITLGAQTTPVPDPVFENKLIALGIDSNGITGNILNEDAEGVINLNVTNSSITDLSGIEAFVDLEMLDCDTNLLTALDLSSNTKLKIVDCQKNILTNLNVSANEALVSLSCQENQLAGLNLSNNLILSDLSCQDNLLSNLDLTNNTELYQIICHDNDLTQMTFPTSQNKLEIVWCYNNQLESIDLTNAPILATLRFENNNLSFLDLRNGNNTNIHTMDARNNTNLSLICVDNIGYSGSAPNWNKDITAQYSESCLLGVENVELNAITIYPNPARDLLTVSSNAGFIKKIELYDQFGQLMTTETSPDIHVSNYSTGVYFLWIETASGSKTFRKIIIY
ncbi:T9SS type A sorting domain-containing protein [Seonamhaeicola sp.]|uniref:T9SS type A sorting domain-containing protein n=1 Tax=Seonamhaeicola sp. TaxID=1912245 RepID=UPI002630FD9A|nr:T9SS type A sorting domain-containing protein [Seonamhaeicola sp.]